MLPGLTLVAPTTVSNWTPANLASPLDAWVDFSDASKMTFNGSGIASVTSQNAGRPFSQATASQQPTYTASAINGKYAARFVAANSQQMSAPNPSIIANAQQTIFAVAALTTNNQATIQGPSANAQLTLRIDRTNSVVELISSGTVAIGSAPFTVTINTPFLLAATFDTATGAWAIYVNGTLSGSGTKTGVTFSSTPLTKIGSDNVYATTMDGYIGEYDHASYVMTSTDLANMTAYLRAKWGV